MLTREPRLDRLVNYLDQERSRILARPQRSHQLSFSRRELGHVRAAFDRMIRRGEVRLHRLCELLADSVLPSKYVLHSVVVGESSDQRFTLVQPLSRRDLYSRTDLDLGNWQLEHLRIRNGKEWSRPRLIANFIEYEALESNRYGVHKLISRIKAEEEIWNKVVDEIFGLDVLVQRDKELRHLSRFVKDVFGVKIVAGTELQARALLDRLRELSWDDARLSRFRVPPFDDTRRLELIETKDYLTAGRGKASGWRALKSVVNWWDTPVEIQLQPLRNYLRERERLTRESHSEFMARREQLRNQIAKDVPLFGFYRDLLRWLFLAPDTPAPRFGSVEVVVED